MHGCPVRPIGKRLPIYYIKRFRGQNKPEIFGYMRFFTKKGKLECVPEGTGNF